MQIVVADRAEEQAYNEGYDRLEGTDAFGDVDLEGFRSGAEYANQVLPTLRELSGHSDRLNTGTYTGNEEIVIVDEADLESDECVFEGDEYDASGYLSTLVGKWHDGARDALEGRDRGASL